ncbi:MAG: hypothetical protein ACUZ8A_06455 [Candidatus Bathyanammoxibius sp.]
MMVRIIDTTECYYCGRIDTTGQRFEFPDIDMYPACPDCMKRPLPMGDPRAPKTSEPENGVYFKSGKDAEEIFVIGSEERDC